MLVTELSFVAAEMNVFMFHVKSIYISIHNCTEVKIPCEILHLDGICCAYREIYRDIIVLFLRDSVSCRYRAASIVLRTRRRARYGQYKIVRELVILY